jgi:hypothetical protein
MPHFMSGLVSISKFGIRVRRQEVLDSAGEQKIGRFLPRPDSWLPVFVFVFWLPASEKMDVMLDD